MTKQLKVQVKKCRPTSAGRRHKVTVRAENIHSGAPYAPLTERIHQSAGRNSGGRLTVRRASAMHRRKYRIIDWKRSQYDGKTAVVERFERDPNRSALIALICYENGSRAYIILPKGLKIGDKVQTGSSAPISIGNTLPLENIPNGTTIHNIELKPGKGAQLVRSAGSFAQLAGRDGKYAIIRLKSGEMRKVLLSCRATVGEVAFSEHSLAKHGKAGARRWRGSRPKVRGVAMNPIDHPHGGGEGKTSGGRHPVSRTGVPAKGARTRRNKRTDTFRVRRRGKK